MTIEDDVNELARFIEDGCSARPEDKHNALAATRRISQALEEREKDAAVWDIITHMVHGDVGCGCTGSEELSVVGKFERLIWERDRAALSPKDTG